ncbi:Facilitated trehalose transporter Tret1 [Papilio xuthus]|uniref:Facilitated trehalose transporter Tret1 n=1 Tax=Papilio xuthus TaxID=66420 RepID=A0A0N1IBH0_PAPXU|nr:Facilitated trehalose transporter Tret1 [Papilio xuthus]
MLTRLVVLWLLGREKTERGYALKRYRVLFLGKGNTGIVVWLYWHDLKTFADDDFDPKKWINRAWSSSGNQEKEDFVTNTVTRLQLYMKQLSNSLDETTTHVMKSESSQRAMVAVLLVMSVTILMGSIVLQVYAEPLFKEAVPTMQPNLCSVLLAVTYLLASFLCAFMIDKFGRRPLLTVTSVGSALCNFVLGSQLHLRWGPHWLTAATIYAYSFIYNFGAAVVPFVLTAEVFLPEVRGLGNSMSMACMWIMNFVTLIIFNPLVDWLGLGPVFYVFSGTCLLGATYSHFWLPETKGLPADAIQKLFLKKEGRDKKVVK